ncbi:MAG: hypothetical protein ACN4GW_01440 [Desulforhopalus sp.]
MDNVNTLKQMMQTNKMAFDYNFTMMMATYEQNKLLLHTFLNQSTDIPDEAKTAIETWLQGYRKGCEDLKKMTDEGYQIVEKCMTSGQK